jgi:hypothetical protein
MMALVANAWNAYRNQTDTTTDTVAPMYFTVVSSTAKQATAKTRKKMPARALGAARALATFMLSANQ